MSILLPILQWILPAIIVLITVWLVYREIKKTEQQRQKLELRLKDRKAYIPTRLQAHERLIVFLERITPEALVMRLQRSDLSVQGIHALFLKTIRQEWDHNVSQQLYISDETWKQIKSVRENIVRLINTEAGKLKPSDPAMKLSQAIIEEFASTTSPVQKAISAIKQDVNALF